MKRLALLLFVASCAAPPAEELVGQDCADTQDCPSGQHCVPLHEDDLKRDGVCLPPADRGRTRCEVLEDCYDAAYPVESFCNAQTGLCQCDRAALACDARSVLDPIGCGCVRTTGNEGDVCFLDEDCRTRTCVDGRCVAGP